MHTRFVSIVNNNALFQITQKYILYNLSDMKGQRRPLLKCKGKFNKKPVQILSYL